LLNRAFNAGSSAKASAETGAFAGMRRRWRNRRPYPRPPVLAAAMSAENQAMNFRPAMELRMKM